MIASGTYGTKFQRKAYPQAKIRFIHPAFPQYFEEVDALIDSGASGTCIPKVIANKLGLKATNTTTVDDFENKKSPTKNVYAVKISINSSEYIVNAVETNAYAIVGRDIMNTLTTALKGVQQKWDMS